MDTVPGNASAFNSSIDVSPLSLQGPWLYHVVNAVLGLVVILSNCLNIAAIARSDKLRRLPTYTYVVSLSVADLLIGPLLLITVCVQVRLEERYRPLAMYSRLTLQYSLAMSLVSHLLIAVDRYAAVVTPLTYKHSAIYRRPRAMVCAVWLAVFSLGVVPLTYYAATGDLRTSLVGTTAELLPTVVYIPLITLPTFAVLVVTCGLYAVIFYSIHKQTRRRQRMARATCSSNSSDTAPNSPCSVSGMTPTSPTSVSSLAPNSPTSVSGSTTTTVTLDSSSCDRPSISSSSPGEQQRQTAAQTKHKAISRQTQRITRMLGLTLAVLLVCWVPQALCNQFVHTLQDQPAWLVHMYMVFALVLYLNSCMNTPIFAWLGADMRTAYHQLLRECTSCCRRSEVSPAPKASTETLSGSRSYI